MTTFSPYYAIIFQGTRAVDTILYRTVNCATYHDAVADAHKAVTEFNTPNLLLCVYRSTNCGTHEISAVSVGGMVGLNDDAYASLLNQIDYQTAQVREMFSGTGSTNLDVINEFHEITGMITALRLIDVHADGFHLRRAASQTHRLQIAKNHAMTNVTNINALRVVS